MGIKDLSKFIRDRYPQVINQIHLSEFAYKQIAIDLSVYLCHFKASCGDDWLRPFINMICTFRKHDVHPVFVFDGVSHVEKNQEKQERRNARDKTVERLLYLEQALLNFHQTGEIDPVLVVKRREAVVSLLEFESPDGVGSEQVEEKINVAEIEQAIDRTRKQLFTITKEDYELCKQLFTVMDVPYIQAPFEAETLCCDLFQQKLVNCVYTTDTDVFAYKTDRISDLDNKNGTVQLIKYSDIITEMGFTDKQFLDFCIMCKCDYNQRIPKIGIINSFKLIKEYETIEKISEVKKLDITPLNHVRVREMFNDFERTSLTVPYCGEPDWQAFEQFLFVNNVRMDFSFIKKIFRSKLTFE